MTARHLDAPAEFSYALDIRMARRAGIRPMVARVSATAYQAGESEPTSRADEVDAGRGPADVSGERPNEAPAAAPPDSTEDEYSRLDRWKRRLLDLSRRNPLLNLRQTRRAIPLLCPDLAAMEDGLAAGQEFTILPKPKVMDTADPRDAAAHRDRTGRDALDVFLRAQMTQRRLHSPLPPEELERRMLEVSRADRLSLEESGANTLFLALGFLRWYESDKSDVPNLAPIILIPMAIERRSVREGFRVRMLEDESRINVTMLEKLKVDFGLDIDGLDPLPADESGLDVPAIMRRFREAVKSIDRWEVVETCTLAILTFTKFLMWLDLDRHTSKLKESPIVRHLLETPGEVFPSSGAMVTADDLDTHLKPADTYCPLDADSSQLAAVLAAEQGGSFVLQGPPGTGKSQTIANLIAHCMTRGRRVLFVSEKMAALEVVKRRLEAVGLGPFCLELHSRKANKSDFRRQLDEALQIERSVEPDEWARGAAHLEELRAELNAYVRALHQPRPFGQSAYWAINRVIDDTALPDVEADFGAMAEMTPGRADRTFDVARQLQTAAETAGLSAAHPLRDVGVSVWTVGLEGRIGQALERLAKAAEALAAQAGAALQPLRLGSTRWSWPMLDFAERLTGSMLDSPPVALALVRASDWPSTSTRLLELIRMGRTRDELRAVLMAVYTEGVLGLPLEQLQCRLTGPWGRNAVLRWLMTALVRRQMRRVQKAPGRLAGDAMREHLGAAIALKELELKIAREEELVTLFGTHWRGGNPDWGLLNRQVEWVGQFRELAGQLDYADATQAVEVWNLWSSLVAEERDLVGPGGHLGKAFADFRHALRDCREAWTEVQTLLQVRNTSSATDESAPDCVSELRGSVERWDSGLNDLRSWCAYQTARALAVEAGLAPVVKAAEDGTGSLGSVLIIAFIGALDASLATLESGLKCNYKD